MKDLSLFVLLTLALNVYAATKSMPRLGQLNPSNDVVLGGTKYRKELVIDLKNAFPQDVRVDRHTGNIFFISASKDIFSGSGIGAEPRFKVHVLKKGTTRYQDIQGIIPESKAIGIDQTNGIVYIGTERGLYKYDDTTTSGRNFGGLPQDIISVDVGDKGKQIYYVEAAVEKTHKMAADLTDHFLIWDLKGAYGLTIDQRDNYYFTDFYVPYVVKANTHDRVKIIGEDEFFKVADYAVDKDGKVYAVNDKGDVYSVDPDRATATKLGNVGIAGETTSLAVEASGDFLVGYKNGVARLTKV